LTADSLLNADVDRASSQVRLRYSLMTAHSEPTPAEPSLFMEGKFIYTQYFLSEGDPIPLKSAERVAHRSRTGRNGFRTEPVQIVVPGWPCRDRGM